MAANRDTLYSITPFIVRLGASLLALTLATQADLTAGLDAADGAAAQAPRRIRTVRVMSDAYGLVRTIGLLLPPDYEQSTQRYPVLYLLHGSGQQHATWGRQTLLANTTHAIVVMPDMDRTRYARADGTPDAAAETFLVRELPAFIESQYRAQTGRESRAIGGLSAGAFGAMYLGLRHPDRYSAIGAFSAPYEVGGFPPAWLPTDRLSVPLPRIYMGCGVDDSLLASSRRFALWLQDNKVERKYEEGPGAHSWDAWDWQLEAFLKFVGWSG